MSKSKNPFPKQFSCIVRSGGIYMVCLAISNNGWYHIVTDGPVYGANHQRILSDGAHIWSALRYGDIESLMRRQLLFMIEDGNEQLITKVAEEDLIQII